MGCLYSRLFPCPPSKARTRRDDSDSEEKEVQVLSEGVLSGCELAGSSSMEAGILSPLQGGEPLITPHLCFWPVVHKGEYKEMRLDDAVQTGLWTQESPNMDVVLITGG